MRLREWHKHKFPYNPNKPAIRYFRKEDNQPHAVLHAVWQYDKTIKGNKLVMVGCKCTACYAHLELIRELNPDRYNALTNPPEETKYYRPKRKPDYVHARNNSHKALLKWR